MSCPNDDPRCRLRRGVYLVLIAVSTGAILGRILAIDSVDVRALEKHRTARIPRELDRKQREFQKQGLPPAQIQKRLQKIRDGLTRDARLRRPFLSANDRSRWCTVRALVEDEMRVEGVPYAIDKVIAERGWDTIDMVKHDGHLYSSKPPLFPTLMAAEYWLIHRLTGATLATHPYAIGRFMLVSINLLPLVIYFLVLASLAERGRWLPICCSTTCGRTTTPRPRPPRACGTPA